MKEDTVRVLRIVEYIGPRSWVKSTIHQSIHGTRRINDNCEIRAATIGDFPEILERDNSV